MFKLAKTVHALDCAATVIGREDITRNKYVPKVPVCGCIYTHPSEKD
jgi:hypothetical protein